MWPWLACTTPREPPPLEFATQSPEDLALLEPCPEDPPPGTICGWMGVGFAGYQPAAPAAEQWLSAPQSVAFADGDLGLAPAVADSMNRRLLRVPADPARCGW